MINIALVGRMASGKSTLSARLVKEFKFKKVALADAIKEQVIVYGMIPDITINKVRDRQILQDYGQICRGELEEAKYFDGILQNICGNVYLKNKEGYQFIGTANSNYWVDFLFSYLDKERLTVVDDIRRLNELQAFEKEGFCSIKIESPQELRIERLKIRDGGCDLSRLNDISESETDTLNCHGFIMNDGTEEECWNKLVEIINKF